MSEKLKSHHENFHVILALKNLILFKIPLKAEKNNPENKNKL